ncbi:MAG: endolytic transglycosylase MltG [Hyphomicrobium sp.]
MRNTRLPRQEPVFHKAGVRPRSPAEMLEPSRAPMRPDGNHEPVQPPPAGGLIRFVSGVLTLLLVIMVMVGALSALLYHQFESAGPLPVSRVVAIPKGEGRIEIATRLERQGIISNRWTFIASYLLRNALRDSPVELKAGEYEIKKHASMADVLNTLVQGKSILLKLTIPEGLTSQQIVERVRGEPDLDGEITDIPQEGSLLPDTYRFSKGMARQELLERMQVEMQRYLAQAWANRQADLPLKSPQEAIIFASIVEKETGRPDERSRVAGVFMNRLRTGMRLQSDPTVIYGIAGGQGRLGRPITRADLRQQSAHNTYQIKGLPPTPICNPGRSAIDAALKPAETKELFFVADGSGGHAFSTTLIQHNAAVSNWRKVERGRRARQAAAAKAATAESFAAPQVLNAGSAATASPIPLPVRKPAR